MAASTRGVEDDIGTAFLQDKFRFSKASAKVVGAIVGLEVGLFVGLAVGFLVGAAVGVFVGLMVGANVGLSVLGRGNSNSPLHSPLQSRTKQSPIIGLLQLYAMPPSGHS